MILPLTHCALQGLAFVSLKAEGFLPLLSAHIKQNIINQLQGDKGWEVLFKWWRGGLYSLSLPFLHIYPCIYAKDAFYACAFLAPLVFLFDALSTAALRGENDKEPQTAPLVRSDRLLSFHPFRFHLSTSHLCQASFSYSSLLYYFRSFSQFLSHLFSSLTR